MYRNITGTSKSQKAMKFACSDTVPCTHIILNNINLQRSDGTAETYCNSAAGIGYGYINPSAECLSSSDKDDDEQEEAQIVQTRTEHIVHTELWAANPCIYVMLLYISSIYSVSSLKHIL